jgi:hypothetical protein
MDAGSLKASADACKESGNSNAAKLLRELSADKATAYLVINKQSDFNDEIYVLDDGAPQKLFLDRNEAIAYARLQNARHYKTVNPWIYGYEPSEVSDLSADELLTRIRKILGDNAFDMKPIGPHYTSPVFPKSATDEQMLKIAKLFRIEFFEVIKTKVRL